ncbi:hypothetical protein GF337_07910 [candidate division KSB1 bacterium]|nr:hypothetical protein [candidate division KSB1 bacterium]
MKIIITLFIFLFQFTGVIADDLLTVAEKSDFTKTSLHADVLELILSAQNRSPQIQVATLGKSTEGKIIPLVIISEEGITKAYEQRNLGKPVVLILANIHAGEVEGKEACQMLIRDIALGKLRELLENQVILVVPNFNPDGNDKLSAENRRDMGPELAGERYNGQNLDLNRDFIKLESPEVSGLVRIFNEWDPILFVDMHTKNGSYHQAPVTFCTAANPNTSPEIMGYMWNELFPAVQKLMRKKYGYESIPYGNFVDRGDPEKGWRNYSFGARLSTNYVGLRNRLAILDENYPHVDFKTRVLSSYAFIKSILEYTNSNAEKLAALVKSADFKTRKNFVQQGFVTEFDEVKLMDVTLKSYEFDVRQIPTEEADKYPSWWDGVIVEKTEVPRDYHVPYLAKAEPTKQISLPRGYILLPAQKDAAILLQKHGIVLKRIVRTQRLNVEEFKISDIKISDELYQGHVFVSAKGEYQPAEIEIPENSWYISLKQPLARIAAILLEPQSDDNLLAYGYFNKVIAHQWGKNRPNIYPVYRVIDDVPVEAIIGK